MLAMLPVRRAGEEGSVGLLSSAATVRLQRSRGCIEVGWERDGLPPGSVGNSDNPGIPREGHDDAGEGGIVWHDPN